MSRPAEPAAPSCSGWFRHHRHHRSPPQHPVSEARDHPGIDSDADHWVSRSKSRSRRRQDRPRGTGSLPTRRQSPAKAVSHDVRNSGWRVTDICRNMAARVPGTPWPSRPCQKPRPGHDCRTAIPVKKRPMTTGSPGQSRTLPRLFGKGDQQPSQDVETTARGAPKAQVAADHTETRQKRLVSPMGRTTPPRPGGELASFRPRRRGAVSARRRSWHSGAAPTSSACPISRSTTHVDH